MKLVVLFPKTRATFGFPRWRRSFCTLLYFSSTIIFSRHRTKFQAKLCSNEKYRHCNENPYQRSSFKNFPGSNFQVILPARGLAWSYVGVFFRNDSSRWHRRMYFRKGPEMNQISVLSNCLSSLFIVVSQSVHVLSQWNIKEPYLWSFNLEWFYSFTDGISSCNIKLFR